LKQTNEKTIYEAWEMFKELLRRCHLHGIHVRIQVETFYNELIPSTRLIFDASSKGALLSKSYQECYDLVEFITANSYQWTTKHMQVQGKSTAPASRVRKTLNLFIVFEATSFTTKIMMIKFI